MNCAKICVVYVFILAGNICISGHADIDLEKAILAIYGPPAGVQLRHHKMTSLTPSTAHYGLHTTISPIDPSVLDVVFGHNLARKMDADAPPNKDNPIINSNTMERKNEDNGHGFESPVTEIKLSFSSEKPEASNGEVSFDYENRFLTRSILKGQFHSNSETEGTESASIPVDMSKIAVNSAFFDKESKTQTEPAKSYHIPSVRGPLGPESDADNKNTGPLMSRTGPLGPMKSRSDLPKEARNKPEVSDNHEPKVSPRGLSDFFEPKEPYYNNQQAGLETKLDPPTERSGSRTEDSTSISQSQIKPISILPSTNASSRNFLTMSLFVIIIFMRLL